MVVKVDWTRCLGCEACTMVCPVGALEVVDMKCRVKEGVCISCGQCVPACFWMALVMDEEKPKQP